MWSAADDALPRSPGALALTESGVRRDTSRTPQVKGTRRYQAAVRALAKTEDARRLLAGDTTSSPALPTGIHGRRRRPTSLEGFAAPSSGEGGATATASAG